MNERDLKRLSRGDLLEMLVAQGEELEAIKAKLAETEEKLQKIIEELSVLMEKQFREQFKVISENFSQVFQEMFGGGKAYLKLTDTENVLESPIEIVAQPPGKNLQKDLVIGQPDHLCQRSPPFTGNFCQFIVSDIVGFNSDNVSGNPDYLVIYLCI